MARWDVGKNGLGLQWKIQEIAKMFHVLSADGIVVNDYAGEAADE